MSHFEGFLLAAACALLALAIAVAVARISPDDTVTIQGRLKGLAVRAGGLLGVFLTIYLVIACVVKWFTY